jgi:hypothetical protein
MPVVFTVVPLLYVFLMILLNRAKQKRIEMLESKLAKLSATDDEVMCILEATDTPLAKKLLAYANKPEPRALLPAGDVSSDPPKRRKGVWLSESQWRAFRKEIQANRSDNAKLAVVRDWIECGLAFKASYQAAIAKLLRSDVARDAARKLFRQQ